MPVTNILSVEVDKEEYSRFEDDNSIIRIQFFVDGDTDTVTFELRKARRSRNTTVATVTYVVDATSTSNTPHYAYINLKTETLSSPELISRIRRGDYFIRASVDSSAITTTVATNATALTNSLTVVTPALPAVLPTSGEIEINVGTATVETIDYSSLAVVGLNSVLTLSTSLKFSHFVGESVTLETIILESADFEINVLTASKMKKTTLFGIDLQSSDLRTPKFQPRKISGVTINEVSRNHKLSWFPLNYIVDEAGHKFLSWDNGELIEITQDYKEYYLPASGPSAEFVGVKIDWYQLPATTQVESLYIDELKYNDREIRRTIRDTSDYIENTLLQVYMEPTKVVTDVDPSQISFSGTSSELLIDDDYDFIKGPVTFYPRKAGQWIDIQFPFSQILEIEQLFGAVANVRVVHINPEWIEFATMNGFTQLVPFNTELAFDFVGLLWVEALRGAVEIPNFWHYNMTVGLRDTPGDILELLNKQAAISILTVAGQAFRGGFSSQSISRDGISESVAYTSSAIYGIYSATIEEYKTWIKENVVIIRSRYRGPTLTAM